MVQLGWDTVRLAWFAARLFHAVAPTDWFAARGPVDRLPVRRRPEGDDPILAMLLQAAATAASSSERRLAPSSGSGSTSCSASRASCSRRRIRSSAASRRATASSGSSGSSSPSPWAPGSHPSGSTSSAAGASTGCAPLSATGSAARRRPRLVQRNPWRSSLDRALRLSACASPSRSPAARRPSRCPVYVIASGISCWVWTALFVFLGWKAGGAALGCSASPRATRSASASSPSCWCAADLLHAPPPPHRPRTADVLSGHEVSVYETSELPVPRRSRKETQGGGVNGHCRARGMGLATRYVSRTKYSPLQFTST